MTHWELRGKVAETGLKLYQVAPFIPCHPAVLGEILNGRRALPPGFDERVLRAIERASPTAESARGR
jgi:hypothetical protein